MRKNKNTLVLGKIVIGDPEAHREEKGELEVLPGLWEVKSSSGGIRVRLAGTRPSVKHQAQFNCHVESGMAGVFVASRHPAVPRGTDWMSMIEQALEVGSDSPQIGQWGVATKASNGDHAIYFGFDGDGEIVEISIRWRKTS